MKRLRNNPQLCEKVRENGKVRGQEIEPQNVVRQWRSFLKDLAIVEYQEWCSSSRLMKQLYLQRCYLSVKLNGFKNKIFTQKIN